MSRLRFCRNSVCSVAQADVVLSVIQFLAWSVSIFFMAKDVFKGGLRKPASTGVGGGPMKENVMA